MPWDDRIRRRLKLRDLDVLMEVIQVGSMGKAAGRFNMTQPAVSKVVADLEHTLGVRLLDRSREGVEPTAYGRALVKRGVAVFDELRQGVADIDFLSDPTAGEVRIGTTEPLAAAIISPVIDHLSQKYPRMSFHVITGDGRMLDRQLAARDLDLVICRAFQAFRGDNEEHSVEILFHTSSVVATGEKNPLTRRRKITLAELLNERWLMGPIDSEAGALQADVFHSCGLAPPRLTVSSMSSNLRSELLAAGRFLTVLPDFFLRLPRRHPWLRALPVDLPDTRMPVAVVTLKNRSPNPTTQLFIKQVRVLTKPLARSGP